MFWLSIQYEIIRMRGVAKGDWHGELTATDPGLTISAEAGTALRAPS
jgi:hypothetical protein